MCTDCEEGCVATATRSRNSQQVNETIAITTFTLMSRGLGTLQNSQVDRFTLLILVACYVYKDDCTL